MPSTLIHQTNPQKLPTHFMPLQPKFHLRRNPLRRLNELNVQTQSSNNGYDISKTSNAPPIFKRSNPLFVVNTLIGK